MKWTGLLRRNGFVVEEAGASYDPFTVLVQMAKQSDTPVVHVNCSVGTSREYGEVKCSFSVTAACPQSEKNIDMAGEMVFRKALELTNDAATQLGLPLLPGFQEP